MKDGRTHLAYKAEHAVDLDSGAIVGVTVQGADTGDTASMVETLIAAAEQMESVLPDGPGIEEVASEHSETAARARRRLQPRAAAAAPDRCGHAAEPSGPCRSPLSRPVPAMLRLWGLLGRPQAVLHATLVADAFLPARPELPLHFVSVRTYASGC